MTKRDWLDLVYFLSVNKLSNNYYNKLHEIYGLQAVEYTREQFTPDRLDVLFSKLEAELRKKEEE